MPAPVSMIRLLVINFFLAHYFNKHRHTCQGSNGFFAHIPFELFSSFLKMICFTKNNEPLFPVKRTRFFTVPGDSRRALLMGHFTQKWVISPTDDVQFIFSTETDSCDTTCHHSYRRITL